MKLPISLVIITLNEESNIRRCLESVPWALEIIILDSGSKDKTCEIAASFGAKVYSEAWRGFGAQKARAVELAQNDWILSLDADECLSPELAKEIANNFGKFDAQKAYRIPRKSFYLGRWILHGGWYPDYQVRLFHKTSAQWSPLQIHEHIVAANLAKLESPILHYVFRDISHHVQTNNRYSSLQAEAAFHAGKKYSLFRLVVKPLSKFIECYFLKLGFLDGWAGFFIARSAAYSVFMRWGKVWELEQRSKGHIK